MKDEDKVVFEGLIDEILAGVETLDPPEKYPGISDLYIALTDKYGTLSYTLDRDLSLTTSVSNAAFDLNTRLKQLDSLCKRYPNENATLLAQIAKAIKTVEENFPRAKKAGEPVSTMLPVNVLHRLNMGS